jgi:hypothetical protein
LLAMMSCAGSVQPLMSLREGAIGFWRVLPYGDPRATRVCLDISTPTNQPATLESLRFMGCEPQVSTATYAAVSGFQAFTYNAATRQIMRTLQQRCMHAQHAESGALVTMQPCLQAAAPSLYLQQWEIDVTGRLRLGTANIDLCVDVALQEEFAIAGSMVRLAPCAFVSGRHMWGVSVEGKL